MNLADAVRSVLGNYATFSGRARRSEFWYWGLALSLAYIVVAIITAVIGTRILAIAFILAIIVPSLAVTVRRLHDTGRSGWWYFIAFVPLVGGIVLIVFECQDSVPGSNQYGSSPKGGSGSVPPSTYPVA